MNKKILKSAFGKLYFDDIMILKSFYWPVTKSMSILDLKRKLDTTSLKKLGMEALRKRLKRLVEFGLLKKTEHTNPIIYDPHNKNQASVEDEIEKFFQEWLEL